MYDTKTWSLKIILKKLGRRSNYYIRLQLKGRCGFTLFILGRLFLTEVSLIIRERVELCDLFALKA